MGPRQAGEINGPTWALPAGTAEQTDDGVVLLVTASQALPDYLVALQPLGATPFVPVPGGAPSTGGALSLLITCLLRFCI